jgi:D-serine deaminase-like pyridoxal phosphate-dependent protein
MALDWTSTGKRAALEGRPAAPPGPGLWMPARPSERLREIDTPALILDLDRCELNMSLLMTAVAGQPVRVRPHAKTHKCAELARRQVAAGAAGVCVQKLGEAEAMLAGGIDDVLITNEIVGESKLRRLARVARVYAPARLGVCVDRVEVAQRLGSICQGEGAQLDVYVEIDVGQNRCGVADPDDAALVAGAVAAQPALRLRGLQAYAGLAQHRRGVPERRRAAQAAAQRAAAARDALLAAGLPCETITGGGTGTLVYDLQSGVYNELQPGSYLFMDVDYAKNETDPDDPPFEHSLFVLATVISMQGDRATLDAGLKSFSTDSGPAVPAFDGWRVRSVSDEHTVLMRDGTETPIKVGDKALLIPGHCDPTVNLHDWIVATRKGRVEALWPIEARGRSY